MTVGRIPSVEGGIQPTIVDAKGDLIAAVAADSLNRLAVGSNDQVLVADSAASTGLAWKSYGAQFVAGKNRIINGDYRINQRAFSSTTTDQAYTFDRWMTTALNWSTGTVTYSAQTFTPGAAPVAGYEGINFLRCVTASLTGVAGYATITQRIEDVRTFAGETITMSLWAKAGSGTPSLSLEMVQNFGTGGSTRAPIAASVKKFTLNTSWTRYSFTFTVPSVSGKTIGTGSMLEFFVWYAAGSDYNSRTDSIGIQNGTFDIWGVQVEAGSVATPFTTATGTIQGELAACQRYYYRAKAGTQSLFGGGQAYTTTNSTIIVPYPVQMRITPTALEQSGTASDYGVYAANGTLPICSVVPSQSGLGNTETQGLVLATVASGLVAGNSAPLSSRTSNAYLGWSAEL